MSGDLERSYRRLLWAYPPDWRAERGDELVGVLLDAAEAEGRTRPRLAEALDLAGNGLATRLRTRRSPAAWAEAVAVAACFMAAVLAMRGVGRVLDAYFWLVVYPMRNPGSSTWYTWENFVHFNSVGWAAWVAVVPAFVTRRARWLSYAAVLALGIHLGGIAWSYGVGPTHGGNDLVPWLPFEVATAAVLARPARASLGLRVLGAPALATLVVVGVAARWLGSQHVRSAWNVVPFAVVAGVLLWRRHWLLGTPAGRRFLAIGLATASVYGSSVGLYRVGLPPRNGSPLALLVLPAAILLITGAASRLWPTVRTRLARDREG